MQATSLLLCVAVAVILAVTSAQASSLRRTATIYYNDSPSPVYKIAVDVFDTNGVAVAVFVDEQLVNGWGKVNITTNAEYPANVQLFAAGFAEGYLTRQQIYNHVLNQYENYGFPHTAIPEKIASFMTENLQFMRQQQRTGEEERYWRQVSLVLNQLEGLVYGYNYDLKDESMSLNELQLFMLNAAGDLEDLIGALTKNQFKTMKTRIFEYINSEKIHDDTEEPLTDCSALVKYTGSDLYAGHTTWRSYGIIDKMYKVYNFGLKDVASRKVSFSSSPGFLSSKDDFYIMQDSHMVSMETTNSIFNLTLYDALTPKSVLCWVRSIVANQMANSGKEWTDIFAKYNSGSYNNQWMVVDYKQFTPGSIAENTLWILEQIPGYTRAADVSDILRRQSYWSSYNIPYFENVYNMSGYPAKKVQFGDDFDYMKCARHKIFEREQAKVKDLQAFGRVLQFNQWQTDPFSDGLASMSISSRYDLRAIKPVAFGGIDSKITSAKLALSSEAIGICGPTHQDQVPFDWTSREWNVSHVGQPNVYNFDWIPMKNF